LCLLIEVRLGTFRAGTTQDVTFSARPKGRGLKALYLR